MQFYFDSIYSDPDPMLDIIILEEEQQAAQDLGYVCTVELD